VIWSLLCIPDSLAAFIGKRDSNIVSAPLWEWASTEGEWFLALHLVKFVIWLVADIHLWDIGSLYGQKQQWLAPCIILKISFNGASTVLGIKYFVIKASHGSARTEPNYGLPWLVKKQYTKGTMRIPNWSIVQTAKHAKMDYRLLQMRFWWHIINELQNQQPYMNL
jgi:hypothetical protein